MEDRKFRYSIRSFLNIHALQNKSYGGEGSQISYYEGLGLVQWTVVNKSRPLQISQLGPFKEKILIRRLTLWFFKSLKKMQTIE